MAMTRFAVLGDAVVGGVHLAQMNAVAGTHQRVEELQQVAPVVAG